MAVILGCVCTVAPAEAQLNTQHIKGTVGLKSGSQAPPGVYFIAPLFYVYKSDDVKDRHGNSLPFAADLTSQVYGGGINVVTKRKLFGGFYGFQIVFPVGANNRIQGTEIDANPGAGLTDSVITPINLGWHLKRADATVGYTIFAPTGRYSDGANNNTGLGMWGQEFSVGTTVYLNESRQWHAATLATFDFQSKKSQLHFRTDCEHLFLHGFLKVNYQWEVYARTTTQGSALTILATFLMTPLKLSTP